MKKALLYSSFMALALLLGISVFNTNESGEYYKPRETSAEKGISGAIEWYNMLRGDATAQQVLAAREQVIAKDAGKQKKSALNLNWQSIGPNNVGGRTRAFLIDNNDPNIFYAGSVSGGLFKSTDKGNSWVPVSDPGSNLAVVSIAQAPDGTIYYGTGEFLYIGYFGSGGASTPGFVGGGIYKSTDGGQTFNVLPSTVPNSLSPGAAWAAVAKLGIDPNNSERIYAGTNSGLMISEDGGDTWERALTISPSLGNDVRDMVVTPTGAVWAKVGSTIQYSANGDKDTYTEITGPGSIPRNSSRMRIAVAPQDENYVYVVSIDGNRFGKTYQSTNGGQGWRIIGQRTSLLNPHGAQGNYNNAVTVSPYDKERIIVGGVQLYEWSEDSGWQQIASTADVGGFPFYVHADNHDVIFSPTNPQTFYVVNDGGVFRTIDDGFTFSAMNNNYTTMQFYHIGIGPEGRVMGGSQDNGTVLLDPTNNVVPALGFDVFGGDGGFSQLSRLHPGILIGESQNGSTFRSTDYGDNWSNYVDRERMAPANIFGTYEWGGWVMPYLLWEKLDDPHSTDSIRIAADSLNAFLGFGGGASTFSGTFFKPYDTTIIVPDGVQIFSDTTVITTNAQGEFINEEGDSVGFVDVVTGNFEVSFGYSVFENVIARAATRYNAGSEFVLESATNDLPIRYTLEQDLDAGEAVMVQDPVQAAFFLGARGNHSSLRNNTGGIWMTREILTETAGIPEWWHIGDVADNEAPMSMAVSDDGDVLFVGTSSGRLYRFSNLINARDSASADIDNAYDFGGNLTDSSTSVVERSILRDFGSRAVTSVSVHPDDKDKVVVTLGNYGATNFVYYSSNATATNPQFSPVQGDLPEMPVYASTFNYTAENGIQVLVGTEQGVYTTEDVEAGSVQWTHEINNFANVPVFTLVQERTVRYDLKEPMEDFEGSIYAGTHGRGIYVTNSTARYVGMDEAPSIEEDEAMVRALEVYPNPAAEVINIDLNLESRSDVEIFIHDINGKMVKSVKYTKLPKETQKLELRVNSLARGTYIISMQHEGHSIAGKFIKS